MFFLIPIVWLLLATTKSETGLVNQNPFSFGSLGQLRANWDWVMAFQGGAVRTWMVNPVVYALLALVITLAVSIPAGTRWPR